MHRDADRALIRIASRRMHMRRLHKHQKRQQSDADKRRYPKRPRAFVSRCGMAGVQSVHGFDFSQRSLAGSFRTQAIFLSIHILVTFAEPLLLRLRRYPQGFSIRQS